MENVFTVRQGYTSHDKDCLSCAEEPWCKAKTKWYQPAHIAGNPDPYSWQPWIFDPMVQICARHLYKNNPQTLDPWLSSPPTLRAALIAPPPLLPPSSRRSPLPAPPLPPSSRCRPFSMEMQ
jgi:hypothetical protein